MSRNTIRLALLGLTLGVLLALLIAPQTRWLVRFQTLSLLRFAPLPGYVNQSQDEARFQAVAAHHPDDFQLQFASRRGGGMDQPDMAGLRALENQFPNNASLRANILRLACVGEVHVQRTEVYLLQQGSAPPKREWYSPTPTPPAQLMAFDRDAAAGERLDPTNAYFPFMRAVGLYVGHRDKEAQAALLRAGTRPRWAEYYDDEIFGRWRLQELAFGDRSALWHAAVTASVLLPQYSSLRGTAFLATYQAMQAEQSGNFQEGLAIRHALMHCGDLMRTHTESLIGALVGMAILETAMQRPDGAPWIHDTRERRSDLNGPSPAAPYAAYLRRQGQFEEARWALAEDQADRQATRSAYADLDFFNVSPFGKGVHHLLRLWIDDLLLMANVLWLLALSAAAISLRQRTALLQNIPIALRVVGGLIALGLIYLLAHWMAQGILQLTGVVSGFGGPYLFPLLLFSPSMLPLLAAVVLSLAVLIGPLCVLLLGLIRRRRAPLVQTVTTVAPVFVCLALLFYAATVLGTVRQEKAINAALIQGLQGEGRDIAARTGGTWPGEVH